MSLRKWWQREVLMNKTYTLYAGVNGAGKTTLYNAISFDDKEERVNADEILVSNGWNWRDEKAQLESMKIAVRKIDYCIKNNISFNQETTLAGQSILGIIKRAKEQGFLVRLYYIGLDSADLAVQRVSNRVKNGGHGVEESLIRKRYETSLSMLEKVLPLCDNCIIIDNSVNYLRVARYENGELKIFSTSCNWFNKFLEKNI